VTPTLRIALLAFGSAVGLGIARFAYALVLPDMRANLDWTYAQAGWINTTNAAGYLIGALSAAPVSRMTSRPLTYAVGMVVTVATVFAMGLTGDFGWLNVWRFTSGLSAAWLFVIGGSIAAELASERPDKSGFLVGLFYAGPGLGIALSGLLIPSFMAEHGASAWTSAWFLLGGVTLLLGAASLSALRTNDRAENHRAVDKSRFSLGAAGKILTGYLAFGAGYIGYMTYMFAYLDELGASANQLTIFWVAIGASAMISPWLWSRLIQRARNGNAFVLLVSVTLVGAVLPLVVSGFSGAVISAILFGVAFFAVVASTTAFVRRNAPQADFPFAIGAFTAVFGIGQTAGPILVGALSDETGSLAYGLSWSCGFLILAIIVAAFQRDGASAMRGGLTCAVPNKIGCSDGTKTSA